MDKKRFISLMVLTFLIILSCTLAYYANVIKGNVTGRSKEFIFNVYKIINDNETTFSDINLYDTAKVHNGTNSTIVPGDYGDFIIKVSSKGSELKIRYDINLKGNDIPVNMKFYLDSDKIDKIDITDLSLNGILNLNEEKEYTIYWEWPYDSGDDNIYDVDYENKTFTIGLNINGKQTRENVYAISYVDFDNSAAFPSVINKDEELTIDLSGYNYTSLSLKQGNNNLSLNVHYTYENGILKLYNIIDNLTITNLTSFCSRYSEINSLTDCLIATDYHNFRKDKSLVNARKNIEGKKADFTKVEPYLTYTENNVLNLENKFEAPFSKNTKYYYTTSTPTFDSNTGEHKMSNSKFGTIEDIKNNNGYTCLYIYDSKSCLMMYKIYEYEETEEKIYITKYDKYTFNLNDDYSSKAGLFSIEDENNTKSYYYRGEVNNNWVSFGDFYWRILRINGDGSIRLIYSGTKDNHSGSGTTIGKSQFNSKYQDTTYIGYMYNDDMEFLSYPNNDQTKVSGYKTYTKINSGTKYYFMKNFNKDSDCSKETKVCTLTCNVGTDCIYTTWSELYNNYDKDDSTSTSDAWKYTGDYKYTCWENGKYANNKVSCSVVSEIRGVLGSTKNVNGNVTYTPYNNKNLIQFHGYFSSSYDNATKNAKNSSIKNVVDNWYKTNIYDKNLEDYIQNQIFCNDRSISTKTWSIGDGYSLNKTTLYSPYYRMMYSYKPSVVCQNDNDKFTLKLNGLSKISGESGYGNNSLDYPVGLITIDEFALAGGVYNVMNPKYYLNNNNYTWTMSPTYFYSDEAYSYVWAVNPTGILRNYYSPVSGFYVRPVINLKANIQFKSGSGTESDPYVIE